MQTQRDPVPCVSSTCSLIITYHPARTAELDLPKMVDLVLCLYETWHRRSIALRGTHPSRVFDVAFEYLVTDPVGVVRGIYDCFVLPWSVDREAALASYIARNPQNKNGRHIYSAADFGLSDSQVRDRLPAAAA